MTKSDGSVVTVKLDTSFKVTEHHRRHGLSHATDAAGRRLQWSLVRRLRAAAGCCVTSRAGAGTAPRQPGRAAARGALRLVVVRTAGDQGWRCPGSRPTATKVQVTWGVS